MINKSENIKKYNKSICIPIIDYIEILESKPLVFTKHIQNYLKTHDYKHNFNYHNITREFLGQGELVELETIPELNNEKIHKLVIRTRINTQKDLVTVVILKEDVNLIVTAWLNNNKDSHNTLDTTGIEKEIPCNIDFIY